jgi:hypothetical protein
MRILLAVFTFLAGASAPAWSTVYAVGNDDAGLRAGLGCFSSNSLLTGPVFGGCSAPTGIPSLWTGLAGTFAQTNYNAMHAYAPAIYVCPSRQLAGAALLFRS